MKIFESIGKFFGLKGLAVLVILFGAFFFLRGAPNAGLEGATCSADNPQRNCTVPTALATLPASANGELDAFASCLTEKGVKMYGAYWCPHCSNQKQLFGDSWKLVKYVECAQPGTKTQAAACSAAGIKGYPTWDFAGKKVSGELSLEKLSELSGCSLPASD